MTKQNALQSISPAETFRANAAARLHAAADMTLHELVDEFVRLSDLILADSKPNEDRGYGLVMGDEAKVAQRDRNVVTAACRARFGLQLETFDRGEEGEGLF